MIVADISRIARIHGGRTIFRDLSWSIQDGDRVGLIGPSGGGKSTLVRLLAGIDRPDEGAVTFRRGVKVAYLAQEFSGRTGRTALDEVLAGHDDLAALDAELHAAEARMADPAVQGDLDAFDRVMAGHERLLGRYDELGGPMLRNRAEGLLRSLGLPEASWPKPMELLSGGQRKIVGLARSLLAGPDLLLLDEPDNHLDLAHKAMLERVIREHEGAVIVVSHDRYLLDETVTAVVELEPSREGARLKRWEGNYSAYAAQRELALLRQQQDYQAQQKEIARLEEAIVRFKVWASVVVDERHIKQARNKQRQIDRMDKVERPVLERRRMALQFRAAARGGAKAVELRSVGKAFGDQVVLLDANATVMNGERVGIVGPNGSGKSVLLKLITGEHSPDEGVVWIGPSMKQGQYAQEHETLDFAKTPIEAVREVKAMFEGEAVAALARFLLPFDTLSQPIARLSGGEKSRVQLARLMLLGANLLLLDEPTNNLDIPAAEVLEDALEKFSGTVIVVSHDRYLLDRLVDRVIEVKDGEVRVFEGGYSYYAEHKGG
ncbi:MAG: ribosomal protection-like ABC-F family protein [Dehalococcoidia bacterium]